MEDSPLSRPPKRRRPFLRGCLMVLLVLAAFFLLLLGISRMDDISLSRTGKVAVIPVSGMITDSEQIIDQLKKHGRDASVKAVILRINSPGGGVAPSQEIYEEVRKLNAKKPVLTSMGTIAASGGYYIASATRKVYANPGTMTGSIGVIMPFVTVKDLVDKIGLKGMAVKSGPFKDIGSPLREMTPLDQEVLQSVVDNVHRQFVNAVAKGRRLPPEEVMKIADGRIFTGEQAKALGLVDALGNLEDTVDAAAKLGGISGEPKVILPPKSKISLFDLIREEMSSFLEEKMTANPLRLN